MDQERYLNEFEVADIRNCAPQTLRNERCRRVGIPYCKVGRSVRYKLTDVLTFMERHRIELQSSHGD
jgi:hypothetical protein